MKICISGCFLMAGFLFLSCGGVKKQNENNMNGNEEQWVNMLTQEGKWHVYNKPGVFGESWHLKDGVLHLDASEKVNGRIVNGGNLVYDEVFENFHFKFEWKISEKGNSGLLFLSTEDPKYSQPYETGPEMQILDNEGHSDGKINKHRAGDLYDLIACKKESVKKVGEWNLAEIKLKDGLLQFYLNGEEVVKTTMWDANWNQMIAGSKFKTWANFAKSTSGKIVLQDHDNEVWFRNMMVKKL